MPNVANAVAAVEPAALAVDATSVALVAAVTTANASPRAAQTSPAAYANNATARLRLAAAAGVVRPKAVAPKPAVPPPPPSTKANSKAPNVKVPPKNAGARWIKGNIQPHSPVILGLVPRTSLSAAAAMPYALNGPVSPCISAAADRGALGTRPRVTMLDGRPCEPQTLEFPDPAVICYRFSANRPELIISVEHPADPRQS